MFREMRGERGIGNENNQYEHYDFNTVRKLNERKDLNGFT